MNRFALSLEVLLLLGSIQSSVLESRNITTNSLFGIISELAENGTQSDGSLSLVFQSFLINLNNKNKLKATGQPSTLKDVTTSATTLSPSKSFLRICIQGNCRILPNPQSTKCYPTQCGQPMNSTIPRHRSRRVVGGTRAARFSHPWTAMLAKRDEGQTFYCGASIICSHWLLTVAHCLDRPNFPSPILDPASYTIYVGRHAGWFKNAGSQVQTFDGRNGDIHSLFQHPGYQRRSLHSLLVNDIALIRLRRPIQFNQYAQPACLPQRPPVVNELLWATGWGNTRGVGPDNSALKQIAVKIRNKSICDQEVLKFQQTNTSGLLCAGGERNQDTCVGDSGGPLVGLNAALERPGRRWWLYGLTSLGSQSCNTNSFDQQPSLYVNVKFYLPWIEKATEACCSQ